MTKNASPEQTENVSVIIADDHPIFRKGLRELIDSTETWQVIAEAETGKTALAHYRQYQPDIVILDISMGEMNGLEVAEKLLTADPDAKCIIMTMYRETTFCQRALALGVKGYLLKDDASDDMLRCLARVSNGDNFVSRSLDDVKACCPPTPDIASPELSLSKKELALLRDIADLKTNKEIAQAHNISIRTVQTHRQNMSTKLNLSGRHALIQFAVKWAEGKLPTTDKYP